jgi:hypothetical protein
MQPDTNIGRNIYFRRGKGNQARQMDIVVGHGSCAPSPDYQLKTPSRSCGGTSKTELCGGSDAKDSKFSWQLGN